MSHLSDQRDTLQRDTLLEQLLPFCGKDRSVGLLCCVFRNYRRLEALYGADVAEQLISAGRRRMQQICPSGSTIQRLQPDALVAVIAEPGEGAALEQLAHRCVAQCRLVEGRDHPPLVLTLTVGAAIAAAGSKISAAELLNQATLAALQAQALPGSRVVLAPSTLLDEGLRNYRWETELHQALERQELTAWLQPIVALQTRRPIGFECLARWPQADGRVVSPSTFLGEAHSSGITPEIDLLVIRNSLAFAEQLAAAQGLGQPLLLSANLSAQLIESAGRRQELLELIRHHPLPPGVQLQLELLEEQLQDGGPGVTSLIDALHGLQVLTAIDDFGTGYSSLSRLHNLNSNTIKIDRSFVQRINDPAHPSNHLIELMVTMGRELRFSLTAEGIETDEQADWLTARGVEHGQGFLFGKPMSREAAIDYLTASR